MTDCETSDDGVEQARERLAKAMALLADDDAPDGLVELQLQHAHAKLGGEKKELYQHVDADTDHSGGDA